MPGASAAKEETVKIVVTGGAGFIGSNFVRLVLAEHPDDEIVVLDKLTYAGNLDNLKDVADDPRYRFVKGDICDAEVVERDRRRRRRDRQLRRRDPRRPLDLGAPGLRHAPTCWARTSSSRPCAPTASPASCRSRPTRSTATCSRARRSRPTRCSPSSPYSASKAAGDLLVLAYRRTFGTPVVVTRCSNNYGPYQYPEKLIPLFVTNLLDGQPVPVYGDGLNVRDWIYVDDNCRAVDLVLRGASRRDLQHRRRQRGHQPRPHASRCSPGSGSATR